MFIGPIAPQVIAAELMVYVFWIWGYDFNTRMIYILNPYVRTCGDAPFHILLPTGSNNTSRCVLTTLYL